MANHSLGLSPKSTCRPPLIRLNQLTKGYCVGSIFTTVLKNINLTINYGEMIAIVGPSGSGKSTLMNLMGLLDKADSGEYFLRDKLVTHYDTDELAELRNQHIGFVFQQFNLLPRFNTLQNVSLPLTYRKDCTPISIQNRARQVLAKVGMEKFLHHLPTQLSGGQQQRVAISRALVGNPEMILADEPTGALDSATGQEIMNLFLALNQEGKTIVIVTHDEKIAEQCQRKIIMKDGRIITGFD
ncbi:ABC transporter ATP-binding protein (plasmid) [Legionella adelaidensis]|uniref:ABC transporter ATP-binding protein n=2 Tax=Legionella adelaidensis TaxID=45056 RepID=A0A0W0R0L0_9GAMM|nr:ABC transporter ATP-binding protein [Legionella adelaidensis]KTC64639.1 ABC transporter ATP-binding protein [Legionella adelaidensis]VEH86107.1 ABC transporter ATP-binding protein [Legionella adelaidensis]